MTADSIIHGWRLLRPAILRRMFIGNLPDLARVGKFFESNIPAPDGLRRHDTLLGIWRTEPEIAKLAADCGWRAEFSRMPSAFYGAHFRFDATLVKRLLKITLLPGCGPLGDRIVDRAESLTDELLRTLWGHELIFKVFAQQAGFIEPYPSPPMLVRPETVFG